MADKVVNKFVDVDNGDAAAVGATTYPNALIVAFKSATEKTELIDALCTLGNWAALDPATRPTKAAFARREIQLILKDKVKAARQLAIAAATPAVSESDLP